MLSVVFVCMAAADAQEISQLDNSYLAICDTEQHKIWYDDNANNVWNDLSEIYPTSLNSVNRFYGKDITVVVPVATKFTISPSASNTSDAVHKWSSPVQGVTISATVPFDQLPVALKTDAEITVQIPSDQLNAAELNKGDTITATILSNQLGSVWPNANERIGMNAVGVALPSTAGFAAGGVQVSTDQPASLSNAASVAVGCMALPSNAGLAPNGVQVPTDQLAPWWNAAGVAVGCMALPSNAGLAPNGVQVPTDQLAPWWNAAGVAAVGVALPSTAGSATTGVLATDLAPWWNAAGAALPSSIAGFATTGVQVPTDQLAAALTAGAATTSVQIPYDQFAPWLNGAGNAGSATTSVQIPYDQLVKLNTDAAITAELHLEGIFRNCYTPDPSFLWDQFLIRSKGEIVICQ